MNWDQQNIKVYNQSAQAMSEYFSGIGSRTEDIERGIALAGNPSEPRIVEIGCGDGRDTIEIARRAGWYEAFDPSAGFIAIARKNLPTGSFVVTDALSYTYPQNLDVVFAFASLLHVNKENLAVVFDKIAHSLKSGGILYLSLKERPTYTEETKSDQYGERMFYFYNADIIKELSKTNYEAVYQDSHVHGHTDWLTIALKRV